MDLVFDEVVGTANELGGEDYNGGGSVADLVKHRVGSALESPSPSPEKER